MFSHQPVYPTLAFFLTDLKKNKKVPKGNLEWQDFFCAMFVFFLINERILGLSFVDLERSQNISDKIESSFSKDIYTFAFNVQGWCKI